MLASYWRDSMPIEAEPPDRASPSEGTVKLTGAGDSSPENALSSGLLIRYKSPVASRKTLGLEGVDSGSLRDDAGQLGTSSEPHHGQRETVGCVSLI